VGNPDSRVAQRLPVPIVAKQRTGCSLSILSSCPGVWARRFWSMLRALSIDATTALLLTPNRSEAFLAAGYLRSLGPRPRMLAAV
jgi:hypothetical protein